TYAEFLAAIGTTDDEFAPFYTGLLPLNIPGDLSPIPGTLLPPRQLQREVCEEIVQQLIEHVQGVISKYPDDVWLPFQILARAEKLITSYIEEEFDELVPLQQEVRRTLHTRWRMARRKFIRRALMCADDARPLYHEVFQSEWFNDSGFGTED